MSASRSQEFPRRAVRALQTFLSMEAAAGILLIAAAVLALALANTPLAGLYEDFRHFPVQVRIGSVDIDKPLLLWINDGLMAVFFLLVALEIKREVLSGQLSSRAQLIQPLLCAFGGIAVPAAIFAWINRLDPEALRGWAIPAATDIAFALGILSLLGSRVPMAMKLLLSTIAVLDDLAAILIIAVFYTEQLSAPALMAALVALTSMIAMNRLGVRAVTPYLLLGAVMWVCVLKSGVHATLAGVATGLLIPHLDKRNAIDDEAEDSPLERLEHALHPWVAYAILPVFAFANAGLTLIGLRASELLSPLPLGIALGLLIGKPVGIVGAAMLGHWLGWARLHAEIPFHAIVGVAMLCGIGFTMSLFIASLAFDGRPEMGEHAVLGVLSGSVISAVLGYLWLRMVLRDPPVRTG